MASQKELSTFIMSQRGSWISDLYMSYKPASLGISGVFPFCHFLAKY